MHYFTYKYFPQKIHFLFNCIRYILIIQTETTFYNFFPSKVTYRVNQMQCNSSKLFSKGFYFYFIAVQRVLFSSSHSVKSYLRFYTLKMKEKCLTVVIQSINQVLAAMQWAQIMQIREWTAKETFWEHREPPPRINTVYLIKWVHVPSLEVGLTS